MRGAGDVEGGGWRVESGVAEVVREGVTVGRVGRVGTGSVGDGVEGGAVVGMADGPKVGRKVDEGCGSMTLGVTVGRSAGVAARGIVVGGGALSGSGAPSQAAKITRQHKMVIPLEVCRVIPSPRPCVPASSRPRVPASPCPPITVSPICRPGTSRTLHPRLSGSPVLAQNPAPSHCIRPLAPWRCPARCARPRRYTRLCRIRAQA